MSITQENGFSDDPRKEELIDGKRILSPRPTGRHTLAVSRLEISLGGPFDLGRGGPGGWWILVEPQILVGRNKLIPDLAAWRKDRLPEMPDGYLFEVVPDWVCEVISPGSKRVDNQVKPPIYWQGGVRYLWLIDPDSHQLQAFSSGDRGWVMEGYFQNNDKIKVCPFDAIELEASDLWGHVEEPPEE
jgi:Uma2 family endonuclease